MDTEFGRAIAAHYAHDPERDRLATWGRWERLRTEELLDRFLPRPPAVLHDVGGARGAYALPLARAGYEVHLLDAWAPHVEAAAEASRAQPDTPLASAAVGDARSLSFDDGSADAVLLLGPLYHLVEGVDRARALEEAYRVLRPGGVLLGAAISRYASTLGGVSTGEIADPVFEKIVDGDVAEGVHRNPDPEGRPDWFTLAYFHRPHELADELRAAGFGDVEVLPVEGVGAFGMPEHQLDDEARREAALRAIRRVERVPELLGASAHLMGVGRV